MALTECVQRCWLLVFCEFKKVLEVAVAETERQLCLQSLHNLPYTGLLFNGLGCGSDGVRAKAWTIIRLDSDGVCAKILVASGLWF